MSASAKIVAPGIPVTSLAVDRGTADVIVIGAGAAGIAAAGALGRAGHTVLVIEARDRIGGRCWTVSHPGVGVSVELGAEFVHGRSASVFNALREAGMAAVDTTGTHLTREDGRLAESGEMFGAIRSAMSEGHALDAADMSFAAFVKRVLAKRCSARACSFARTLVEGFDAADPRRISARSVVQEWCGQGAADAPTFRPFGGYGQMLDRCAGRHEANHVRFQLASVVRAIRWRKGRVEVRGDAAWGEFTASAARAIITLPLGVLKQTNPAAGVVRFSPPLVEKRHALKYLEPGAVIKVMLRFREPFWEDQERCHDAGFFHARDAIFPTFWTTLPVRSSLVTAWAGGPQAQRLRGMSASRIVHHALDSFASLFKARAELEQAWVHDWQSDPYSLGAYSYVVVNGDEARAELAAPLRNTLFFAGEATDASGEAGTVGGALASGLRAAREVIASR